MHKKFSFILLTGMATMTALAQTSYTRSVGDYDNSGIISVGDITTMVTIQDNQTQLPLLIGGGGSLTVDGVACSQYLYGDMDLDGDFDADDIDAMAQVVLGARPRPQIVRTFNAKQSGYTNVQVYGPLKGYINRLDHPDFKAAAAIDVSDFNQKGSLYNLVCENFDEVVAGNAMKMSSVVQSNGYMNFNTVKRFVSTATDAGLNVYGHVLAWHSQQPNAWLASLIADRKSTPTGPKVTIFSRDFSDDSQAMSGWGTNSPSFGVTDGVQYFTNPSAVNYWETQAGIMLDEALPAGQTYTLPLRVRSDAEGLLRIGIQDPDTYASRGDFGNITLSSTWQDVALTTTVTGENAKRIVFSFGDVVGNIYIDDLKLYEASQQTTTNPNALTAAEKKEILTDAMSQWINGMMAATECKVKDWDMINEAVSGGGNVNGYYDLQHFDGFQAGTWDVGGDSFFWQDYFGSEDYGVIVERLARKAFADHGGNPDDLKLFVNDYNLESDWDDNKKLQSLIYWVGIWEKRGAKIDGLGTQMHISYSRNASTQASKEAHITKMFQLMAATGKLVRVSELDMGITDASGEALTTDQITAEDKVAMAEYYEWIVKQYFTLIPKAQQYGICQWALPDSPEKSGWRANQPIGLYDLQYNRKPAYAGWAEGLKVSWEK